MNYSVKIELANLFLSEIDTDIITWAIVTLTASVMFHAISLGILAKLTFADSIVGMRKKSATFSIFIFTSLCVVVILLNSIEICGWAALYLLHGATDNPIQSLIHSLGAYTTYGDATLFPTSTWKVVSHLEAMNGVIAFGITTAFLYSASGRLHDFAK